MFKIVKAKNKVTAKVQGELNIYSSTTMKAELGKFLAESGNLELDLSEVSEIDSAGIQLLVLAKRECKAQHRSLTLRHSCPSVTNALELLDLTTFFEQQPANAKGAK